MSAVNSCPGNLTLGPFHQYAICMALLCEVFHRNPNLAKGLVETVPPTSIDQNEYDFIVIGAGSAGATVAGRLSENRKWKVALFEAGPNEPYIAQIPSFYDSLQETMYDWNYFTTNESHACLQHNGTCQMTRGKNLGGCTVHNGMAYHRGNPQNYKSWVEMGNEGWSYEEVLKFFLKSEDNAEIDRVGSKYHATGGPMRVERFRWQPLLAWKIIEAAVELGYGTAEDLVGDQITGFAVAQTMSKNGIRQSSAKAFLKPHTSQSNFDVYVKSTVTKLIMKGKRVIGVEYIINGNRIVQRASAKHEVIVSGGTINSPQLLLLSGIGPKDHLKSVGIDVVHDLPGVGENFHNHVSYGLQFDSKLPAKNDLTVSALREYAAHTDGPMSSTGLGQLIGNVASEYTTKDNPDLQFYFAGHQAICFNSNTMQRQQLKSGRRTFDMVPVVVQPRSRGRLTLRTANYYDYPIIWSNDLGDDHDRKVLIDGIRIAFQLANSSALRPYGLKLLTAPTAACSAFRYMSDAYWNCSIQFNTRTENHQAGSCKMGPKSDRMAVVDHKLRVHGIKGLRVADASIMPQVIAGNPAAVVTMIGERAADFIKKEYEEE